MVIESVNSHANWFFCIQSSGNRAFDFHLLFSLAACSVSMQISFFIQFSVGRKTTISCIIISVNKRETLSWIFMRLQLQWKDADSLHSSTVWKKASGQLNSAPCHLPPLRNFLSFAVIPDLLPKSAEIGKSLDGRELHLERLTRTNKLTQVKAGWRSSQKACWGETIAS